MAPYQETTHTSWGGNIKNSFTGFLLGIVMFIASFPVLWWNEGRINLASVAKLSEVAEPGAAGNMNEKFISITGEISAKDPVYDAMFLKSGKYVIMNRTVEYYAWEEDVHTEKKKDLGGGTTEVKEYRYKLAWTSDPKSVSSFNNNGVNQWEYEKSVVIRDVDTPYSSDTFKAGSANIGKWVIDPDDVSVDVPGEKIELSPANAKLSGKMRLDGDEYVYIPNKSGSSGAQFNDIRISFNGLENGTKVTAFGLANGNTIEHYNYNENEPSETFARVMIGDRETAIAQLNAEHQMLTWILRGVGFLLMWVGLSSLFGPLVSVLNVLPFLGDVGGFIIGIITFVLAAVLSFLTIIISMLFHNILALIIVAVVVIALIIIVMSTKKKAAASQ
ncbi:MAG: hypothetical protein A2Y33_13360 [Spirochaetes bacterium GWF1_51_8]|nr:MAG: hypothetical protein A2Y33_13360 [Spirochaetes bacterium GWF1_51_8]